MKRNPIDALDALLTTAEAADILGCTDAYVRFLLAHGELTGRKIGAFQWLLPRDQVEARAANPPRRGRPPNPAA